MYLPDIDTFCRHSEQGVMVPVFRELPADLETPVSVFLKLGRTSPCFLLESVEGGEHLGRYSFIGTNPYLIAQALENEGIIYYNGGVVSKTPLGMPPQGSDPLHLVQNLLSSHYAARIEGLPPFFGGAVGYLAYEAVHFFEKLPRCPHGELELPDAIFLFTDTLVIFDHVKHQVKIISNVPRGNSDISTYHEAVDKIDAIISSLNGPLPKPQIPPSPSQSKTMPLISNFTPQQFGDMVKIAKEYILAGDILQVVLSQRLCRETQAEPFAIYRALRMLNPSPYMFYFDFGNFQLIGSSPEMLVKLEGRRAETRPIAGTRPRGKSDAEDEAIIATLLADAKERAEHVMLVDLGRNDLGRVSSYGSMKVPLFMGTEKYSHVIHIVSSVEGELREEYDAFDLLRACFPAGTVSGAPKIRAMEIISELEGTRRGPYAGAVGYFGFGGNMDTCITIRTIVMKGSTAYLQGGAGIVADSEPMREYEETLSKVKVLQDAIQLAEGWRT